MANKTFDKCVVEGIELKLTLIDEIFPVLS